MSVRPTAAAASLAESALISCSTTETSPTKLEGDRRVTSIEWIVVHASGVLFTNVLNCWSLRLEVDRDLRRALAQPVVASPADAGGRRELSNRHRPASESGNRGADAARPDDQAGGARDHETLALQAPATPRRRTCRPRACRRPEQERVAGAGDLVRGAAVEQADDRHLARHGHQRAVQVRDLPERCEDAGIVPGPDLDRHDDGIDPFFSNQGLWIRGALNESIGIRYER